MLRRVRPFTGDFKCPQCGGSESDPRGKGIRCFGFVTVDGWIHCSRVQSRWADPSGLTWAHPPDKTGAVGDNRDMLTKRDDEKLARKRRDDLIEAMGSSLALSHPDAGPARAYLLRRSIRLLPESLRFHPRLPYWHEGRLLGHYPALLGKVVNAKGRPVTLHRTYLTSDGQKAPVPTVRKLMPHPTPGAITGCAIHFGEPDHRLAVAEGIETALSVAQASSYATWSTISASGMASLIVPNYVEEVVIAADNDASGTGMRVAKKLEQSLLGERRSVRIVMPPEAGQDWNDVLRQKGDF